MFQQVVKVEAYNKIKQKPLIKNSIGTGKKVAGFQDASSGNFEEVMQIRNDWDMELFMEKYDISVVEIRTEQ